MRRDPEFERTVQSRPGRRAAGDRGDVADEDREMNDEPVGSGGDTIVSSCSGERELWIIAEADRSATTVLFPEEYRSKRGGSPFSTDSNRLRESGRESGASNTKLHPTFNLIFLHPEDDLE